MEKPSEQKVGFNISSDPDETIIGTGADANSARRFSLPLRMILASDLIPENPPDAWDAASRVRSVDKNSFADLMADLAPELHIDVPNHIGETPRQLELALRFPDLAAFNPEGLVDQVAPLRQLLHIRTLVDEVEQRKIDLDTFGVILKESGVDPAWAERLVQMLTPPSPDAPASAPQDGSVGTSLDRLLGLVDTGTPPPKAPADAVSALMQAVSDEAPAGPKVERSAAAGLRADLDALMGAQLNAIMAHPALRDLEAAWRGLKFLVDRINFREPILLEVLPVGKDDLSEALYYQVLLPEHDEENDQPPLSTLILDFSFSQAAADVELLEDLAGTGSSLQAPLLAAIDPAFFGADAPEGLARIPLLNQMLEAPEYIAWNKLRDEKDAKFLALALPAFVLRPPYGTAHPIGAFDFEEAGPLWGNAALAVAASMAGSMARTGWPTRFVGAPGLEDLPLWDAKQGQTPLAALVPDAKLSELSKAGFVVLGGRPNHDAVQVRRAMTLGNPEAQENLMAATEAREHVTLACQIFVAQAAHFLLDLQQTLAPTPDIAQTAEEISTRLRAFLKAEGREVPPHLVSVEPVPEANLPDRNLFAVRMVTPPTILPREVSLVLGFQMPKVA